MLINRQHVIFGGISLVLGKSVCRIIPVPFTGPLSKEVVQAIEAGTSVDYGAIRSFADFVLIQVAWCNGGLHFPASCALTLARNCLTIRRDYLCSILPASEHVNVMKCCSIAAAALTRKASHGA